MYYALTCTSVDWQHPCDTPQGSDFLTLFYLPTEDYMVVVPVPPTNGPSTTSTFPRFKSTSTSTTSSTPWQTTSPAPGVTPPATTHSSTRPRGARTSAKKILLGVPVYGRPFIGAASPGGQYHSSGSDDGIFEYNALPRRDTQEVVDKARRGYLEPDMRTFRRYSCLLLAAQGLISPEFKSDPQQLWHATHQSGAANKRMSQVGDATASLHLWTQWFPTTQSRCAGDKKDKLTSAMPILLARGELFGIDQPNIAPRQLSNAVLATGSVALPSIIDRDLAQIIRFGSGIKFMSPDQELSNEGDPSTVVLPCIFGCRLEGPILIATGAIPSEVPFSDEDALQAYYEQLSSVVVVVNDRMTDNARNIASPYRINALFIVEASSLESELKHGEDMSRVLNSLNINAVTALAGPQSLVLVHISSRYYFYRGIANREFLNTSNLAFGSEVTRIIDYINLETTLDPRAKRIAKLGDTNTILLPTLRQEVQPHDLKQLFDELSIDQIYDLGDDIPTVVPQLQVLMNQQELVKLSQALISTLSMKVNDETANENRVYTVSD
ncbi:hypothetical protein V493_00037 [Pseudogymnoascus sp. VKM F-4281 (FW-2241)]|nr:hypothetical protein V493_00037 [Pseudogymnoascus sp. VKM F-4281 (FW-2241)]